MINRKRKKAISDSNQGQWEKQVHNFCNTTIFFSVSSRRMHRPDYFLAKRQRRWWGRKRLLKVGIFMCMLGVKKCWKCAFIFYNRQMFWEWACWHSETYPKVFWIVIFARHTPSWWHDFSCYNGVPRVCYTRNDFERCHFYNWKITSDMVTKIINKEIFNWYSRQSRQKCSVKIKKKFSKKYLQAWTASPLVMPVVW